MFNELWVCCHKWIGRGIQMNWVRKSNEFGGEIKWIGWYENYPTLPNHQKLSKSEKNKVTAGQILSNLKISSPCEGEGAKPIYYLTCIYTNIFLENVDISKKLTHTHIFFVAHFFFYEVCQKSIWLPAPDMNMEGAIYFPALCGPSFSEYAICCIIFGLAKPARPFAQ